MAKEPIDLVSIYESILNPAATVVESKTQKSGVILEKEDTSDDEDDSGDSKEGKKDNKKSKRAIGAITYDSVNTSNYFDKLMKQLNEEFGGDESEVTFDYEGDDDVADVGGKDAESVLQKIKDLLDEYFAGGEDEFGGEEDFSTGEDDLGAGDSIPSESYAFDGAGSEHGAQKTYDGKARKLAPSDLVKSNGDAAISKSQKTGYKPSEMDTGNAKEHGAQGNYDGKAKKLPATDHVNSDGTAKISKSQKTGYGKKEKENLF